MVQIDITGALPDTWMPGPLGCSDFNGTFVLKAVNQCNWRYTGFVGGFPYEFTAFVAIFPTGFFSWGVDLQFGSMAWPYYGFKRVRWLYTSAAKFDCGVARSMTFYSANNVYCTWDDATVTLTPL
jgi:hypothetical protein